MTESTTTSPTDAQGPVAEAPGTWFERLLAARILFLVLGHLAILAAAYWLAFLLRFDFQIPAAAWTVFTRSILWVVLVKLLIFNRLGSFHGWWRYVTFEDLTVLLRVATFSSIVIAVIDYMLVGEYQIPRIVLVLDWGCTVLLFGALRSAWRFVHEQIWMRLAADERKPALLVGADRQGIALARQINTNMDMGYRVVGFLDDNASHIGSHVGGIRVIGHTSDVVRLADRYDAETVLAFADTTFGSRLRGLMDRCRSSGIRVRMIPPLNVFLKGVHPSQIREVCIEDLLRRQPAELDADAIAHMIESHRVLVTGAGGSIGAEICRQAARCRPACLILVERAENSLFQIEQELERVAPEVPLIRHVADIRDEQRMEQIFLQHQPQILFHAAAHKHVPLMELNPGEAILNNVLATKQLADLADSHGVERFVFISSDKAVRPSSVMGLTKQLAERYVHACSEHSVTKFVVVRFGNVLASTGSVVPIFQEQIRRGGPVTVTHPEMKRYFMTISEASQLVLQAAAMDRGGEIFVLDMGEEVKIVDLARDLIQLSGFSEDEIPIVFTGPRPGEKLNEELWLDQEETLPTLHPKLRVARPQYVPLEEVNASIQAVAELAYKDEVELRRRLPELVPDYSPSKLTGLGPAAGLSVAAVGENPTLPLRASSGGASVQNERSK